VDVLAGVDDVPWAVLDHCFGATDDVPGLLRETAAGSAQALEKLGGYMVHQGALYEATPFLVGFLARIAASGVAAGEIVALLGAAASCDGDDQDPGVRGRTRAALAGAVTLLAPLLEDESDEVRDAAAWALPQSLAADILVPLLRDRWEREASPAIAASVLRGLSFLDPAGSVALAAGALAREDSAIRLIAATACVAGGAGWSGGLGEAALAWTADGALMEGFPWSSWSGHPFSDLVGDLAARGDPAVAVELVTAALTGPAAPGVRKVAVLAAGSLAGVSRSAAPGLVAPLVSVVAGDDPEASLSAIVHLRGLGTPAQAADALAVVADVEGPGRRADWALSCLVQTGDPRCIPLLVRDRPHRPFALDALRRTATRPPFNPVLLEEVRACLREELLGQESTPALAGLIGSWGPAAAAAIPDLLHVAPRHGYSAGCALADIAGATPDAVTLLRQAAAGGASLDAAARLLALTGDEEPLLAAVESGLTQTGSSLLRAAEAARALTPARHLVPALATALDAASRRARPGDQQAGTELALALWHHGDDPAPALQVIAGTLSRPEGETTQLRLGLRPRRPRGSDHRACGPAARHGDPAAARLPAGMRSSRSGTAAHRPGNRRHPDHGTRRAIAAPPRPHLGHHPDDRCPGARRDRPPPAARPCRHPPPRARHPRPPDRPQRPRPGIHPRRRPAPHRHPRPHQRHSTTSAARNPPVKRHPLAPPAGHRTTSYELLYGSPTDSARNARTADIARNAPTSLDHAACTGSRLNWRADRRFGSGGV